MIFRSLSFTRSLAYTLTLFLMSCLLNQNVVRAEEEKETKPQPGTQVAQRLFFEVNLSNPEIASDEESAELKELKKAHYLYWAFLPADYEESSEKNWPILIFLHGMGERGQNLDIVAKHGPPRLLLEEKYRNICPFIVISPQCDKTEVWSVKKLDKFLDEIEKKFKVDKSRVYLTGLSMGGFASWNWAMLRPDRFAAVVPICGGGDVSKAHKLVDIPIWAFHGAADSVVKLDASVKIVDAIKAAGGKNVDLTVYPGVNHDSWTETYNNMELYDWLLSKKKEKGE
ncbi:MAG: prolyl oligopeptidase family serine peptidase [Thermoguttaceae bacterium]